MPSVSRDLYNFLRRLVFLSQFLLPGWRRYRSRKSDESSGKNTVKTYLQCSVAFVSMLKPSNFSNSTTKIDMRLNGPAVRSHTTTQIENTGSGNADQGDRLLTHPTLKLRGKAAQRMTGNTRAKNILVIFDGSI